MRNIYKYFKSNFLYCLIYLLFIIELIINLRSYYIMGDESFTYNMIRHSFGEIINLTSHDVHPFLYYFLAKIFTYGINNIYLKIFVLRFISALPYLILLIIGNTYIKNKFSKFVSVMFMFCTISMPILISNMYTIRMYGWATLFTTVFYLLLVYAYKYNNMKIFIFVSLFAILSSYTHYYALITVAIVYFLFLLLFIESKKNIIYLIISIIIDIVFYLPWITILLNQTKNVSETFWSPKLQFKGIIHMIFGSLSPLYSLSIFYIFPVVLLFVIFISIFNKHININKLSIIGMLVPLLVILFGSVLSLVVRHSVLMPRYITPSMEIFWISLLIFIDEINNKNIILKYLLLITSLIIGIVSYGVTNDYNIKVANQFSKTLNIYKMIPKNSAIIYDDTEIMAGVSSYLSNNYTLDRSSLVYKETLDNFKCQNNLNLPKHYKNIFYIRTNNYIKKNNNKEQIIKEFNNKYEFKNFHNIYLPIESKVPIKMYKIKQ